MRLQSPQQATPTARVTILVAMLATVSTALPLFLTGALAVQLRQDFIGSATLFGWLISSYYIAGATGSSFLGRLGQRFGPRKMMSVCLAAGVVLQLAIAVGVRSPVTLVVALVIGGLANAANQSAVNLLLGTGNIGRLSVAVALKQSSIPAAAILSGLAVPALALTVGWQAAYMVGAAVAAFALALVRSQVIQPAAQPNTEARPEPSAATSKQSWLLFAAGAATLCTFGVGGLSSWIVNSGVDAGISEGVAGVMLSAGALTGILMRLFFGFHIERLGWSPMFVAGAATVIGAGGVVGLAVRNPVIHMVATVVAFGGGWLWPSLFNYAVVRANPQAAGAATGLTQTGVYIGGFSGQIVTGVIIDNGGYQQAWVVVASTTFLGGVLMMRASRFFAK